MNKIKIEKGLILKEYCSFIQRSEQNFINVGSFNYNSTNWAVSDKR